MVKEQIALDEERVKREGKYNLEKMWAQIDAAFFHIQCSKERLPDGAVMYYESPARHDTYFSDFYLPFDYLMGLKWFADYATKWIVFESGEEDTSNFYGQDVLKEAKKEHGFPYSR